jgi:hypothetical protein
MVFDEVQDAAGSKTGAEAAGIGSAEEVDGRRRIVDKAATGVRTPAGPERRAIRSGQENG